MFVDPYRIKEEIDEIRHPFFKFQCEIKDGWLIVICRCKNKPEVCAIEYASLDQMNEDDDFYQIALNVLGRMTIMLVGYDDLESYVPSGDDIGYAYQNLEEDDSIVFWWEPLKE